MTVQKKKKCGHCSKEWGGNLSVEGDDTKGLVCLLEIQSVVFCKESGQDVRRLVWKLWKQWTGWFWLSGSHTGSVATGEELWVGFATKEDVADQALHPVHGWHLTTLLLEWFKIHLRNCWVELQVLVISYRARVRAAFGKGGALLRGQPSLPRPDGSKLQIAEAENWQTNHL